MNDQFLRRMRVEPPPEFLAALKARLDRQVLPPVPRPRPSVIRILVAALLIGGTAFAIGSLAIRGIPTQWHVLSRPAEPDSSHSSTEVQRSSDGAARSLNAQSRAGAGAPREPLWGEFPWKTTQSGDATGTAQARATPANPEVSTRAPESAPATIAQPATFVAPPPPRDYITIVGSQAVYPYTSKLAENLAGHKTIKLPRITLEATGTALAMLCSGSGLDSPDIAEASRRITAPELQRCTQGGVGEVIEVKLGYEAVVLLRSKLYGPLTVSPRDIFLAFAKQVPDPDNPQGVIKNPNTIWNQVNPSLPYDRIELFGPPLSSPVGRAFIDLLVEAGCNTYPQLAALSRIDGARYNDVCRTVRDDGPYLEMSELSLSVAKLEMNPTALALTNFGTFASFGERVAATPLNGVAPTFDRIAAGIYPSRTLYLYVNKARVGRDLKFFLDSYLRYMDFSVPGSWGGRADWALVPPAQAERYAIRLDVMALNGLKL